MIVGPSKIEESAIIQNIDKNQYAMRFIPKESGEHLISVLDELVNKHIPGSPFRVFIGSQHADPSMVHVRGEGLSNGLVDLYLEIIIYEYSVFSTKNLCIFINTLTIMS